MQLVCNNFIFSQATDCCCYLFNLRI